MTPDMVIDIFRNALWLAIGIMSVLILPGLVVGLVVAVFQAATQINESSLSFIPKVFITLFSLMLAGPWILKMIVEYATNLINSIPYYIG